MSLEETKSNDGTPNHSHVAVGGGRSKSSKDSAGGIDNSVGKTSRSKDSSGKKSSNRKAVRFHDIQIRDYERIVGDNPSCSSGPPIG